MPLPEESVVHGSPAPESPGTAEPQHLPALDRLLHLPAVAALVQAHGHTLVAEADKKMYAEKAAKKKLCR